MAEKPKRPRKPRHIFVDPSGNPLKMKHVKKHWRDTLVYHHGTQPTERGTMTVVDVENPLEPQGQLPIPQEMLFPDAGESGAGHGHLLLPGPTSPICAKCKLHEEGAQNPYLLPSGAEQPLITVVCDGVSRAEDAKNLVASDGVAGFMNKVFSEFSKKYNISLDRIRWVPLTRCAWRRAKKPNLKTKGNWCGIHLIQDLKDHAPSLIIPVGSIALGALSHKSNAQDWGGKLLTYRGWPDNWLTNPEFMFPKPDPRNPDEATIVGHPLLGEYQPHRIPMVPVQNPRIVFGSQNPKIIKAWKDHVEHALKMAIEGAEPLNYLRPWYEITWDPNRVKERLQWLIDRPGTTVSFDTETNGLLPWKEGTKIVFIMFRWQDEEGNPQSIGFPWDYDAYEDCPASPLKPYLSELSPYVAEVLMTSRLAGHNLTFDALMSIANIEGVDLDRIAQQCMWDTWHMAYTMKQQRGTLGLEAIAYKWCPGLAGYEEEMTLLIDLHEDKMHPKKGMHAHYANCPMDKWKTHLEPYVMGDVEVVWDAKHGMEKMLGELPTYRIPLAHPDIRGKFRLYEPQSRKSVYDNIVSPASRMLIKLMGRGMHVDLEELARQEDNFPKMLIEAREKLRTSDPRIIRWCEIQEASDPDWEFDLDSTNQLRKLLFSSDGLNLPIEFLTEAGASRYKDLAGVPEDEKLKYAKVDKYTLNKLSVENTQLRALQEYRKLFKAYSSYIRPIRNYYSEVFDKKQRNKEQHLMRDGNVHAQFLLTGTRSGRLASCVPVTELVSTSRGIIPLGDVRVGDLVQSPEGPTKVNFVSERLIKPLVEIHLRNGMTVRSSRDHRHLVAGQWKHVKDMQVGDELTPVDVSGPSVVGKVKFEFFQLKYSRGKNRVAIPTVLDEDLAFIFGHLSAEGGVYYVPVRPSFRPKKSVIHNQFGASTTRRSYLRVEPTGKLIPNRVMTCFGWKEKQLQKYVGRLFHSKFNKKPRLFASHTALCLDLCSRDLGTWLVYHGLGGLACQKSVPPSIFVSPHSVQWSYLRGLFEGDGSSNGPHLTTYSHKLANGVQTLLASLGVRCRVRKHFGTKENGKKRQRFKVIVCPESYDIVKRNRLYWSEAKLSGIKTQGQSKIRNYQITKIVSKLPVEMVDIGVTNASNSFVCNILTHNSNPNLQQLPTNAIIKKIYTSRFGKDGCIYQGDLSQIELRLIAAACGDPAMVDAYWKGIDLHSLSMSRIFNLPYDHCIKDHVMALQEAGHHDEAKQMELKRKVAKTINFLTGYGGGAYGLQATLANDSIYFPIEQCEGFLEAFFDAYPSLRKYLSYYKQFIRNNGVAVSITGRVRVFEDVWSDNKEFVNKSLRAGCNHLIQATASDMMLICLCTIEGLMRAENMTSKLISTVHDSLVIDALKSELSKVHEISQMVFHNIPEVMRLWFPENVDLSWLIVPFAGDSEFGPNYFDMQRLPDSNVDWDKALSQF